AGRLDFAGLPARADLAAPVLRWAAARRRATTDVLLVGIGGSSRGAEVLAGTLSPRGRGARGRPRLHVLDTVDPARAEELFRALSAVGLLPAAFLGVRVRDVLAGAEIASARAEEVALESNPALALAAVHHAALSSGRRVTVCLPYAEALRPFALWWEQLIGE